VFDEHRVALAGAGLRHTESRIAGDSQANSHWRDAPVFADSDLWSRIGCQHLDMVERGARANAVHFAPRASRTMAVMITVIRRVVPGKVQPTMRRAPM
jgi:hypothetical protein